MNSEIKHDQHFMVDEKALKEIANRVNTLSIIEIGPGKGALTKYLLAKANVTAIELDEFMIHELEKQFSQDINRGRLTLIQASALKQRLDKTIFSNLPYGISEPLFYKVLKEDVQDIFLVTGELFYKRLIGNDKLGIVAKACFDIEKIADISKDVFQPKPKVNSTFFALSKKEESFISSIFIQWDKKAKNATIESLRKAGKTNKEAKAMIQLQESIANKKIINLSNEEFGEFNDYLESLQKALKIKDF